VAGEPALRRGEVNYLGYIGGADLYYRIPAGLVTSTNLNSNRINTMSYQSRL
jgi:hypothetical protein